MYNFVYRLFPAVILISSVALMVSPARATEVDYSTTATFNCGSISLTVCSTGTNSIELNNSGQTETLTYTPSGPVTVYTLPPALAILFGDATGGLGNITATSNNSTGASFAGAMFTLDISQSEPPSGSGSFLGVLSGSISDSASNAAQVAFSNSDVIIAGVDYSLTPSNTFSIPAPSTPGGVGIVANITDAAPEPTLFVVTGLGFLGLGISRIRRGRNQAA